MLRMIARSRPRMLSPVFSAAVAAIIAAKRHFCTATLQGGAGGGGLQVSCGGEQLRAVPENFSLGDLFMLPVFMRRCSPSSLLFVSSGLKRDSHPRRR